jgi:hypothetical protein
MQSREDWDLLPLTGLVASALVPGHECIHSDTPGIY